MALDVESRPGPTQEQHQVVVHAVHARRRDQVQYQVMVQPQPLTGDQQIVVQPMSRNVEQAKPRIPSTP